MEPGSHKRGLTIRTGCWKGTWFLPGLKGIRITYHYNEPEQEAVFMEDADLPVPPWEQEAAASEEEPAATALENAQNKPAEASLAEQPIPAARVEKPAETPAPAIS